MLPVTSLNGLKIEMGLLAKLLKNSRRWSFNTGVDIKKQIQNWDSERPAGSNNDAPTPYRFVKMIGKIGFMQGRLSPVINGRIQTFPWELGK